MAIPRSMGWLVVTGGIVLALVGLSFLALDKPNVVWSVGRASCPHCRTAVPAFARRCPTCREEFDWVVAPDEESPWCEQCLTPGEDEALRLRRKTLGEEVATQRVAQALSVSPAAATEWLHTVGRGQCGWCGGTGRDLTAAPTEASPCPVCFGEKRCIACDGDRRVRVGLEAAHAELERYRAAAAVLATPSTPLETARTEVSQANEQFLRRHAGTVDASELWFPPLFLGGESGGASPRAAIMARLRLQNALNALKAP